MTSLWVQGPGPLVCCLRKGQAWGGGRDGVGGGGVGWCLGSELTAPCRAEGCQDLGRRPRQGDEARSRGQGGSCSSRPVPGS